MQQGYAGSQRGALTGWAGRRGKEGPQRAKKPHTETADACLSPFTIGLEVLPEVVALAAGHASAAAAAVVRGGVLAKG